MHSPFRTSDIRGITNVDVNSILTIKLGLATSTFMGGREMMGGYDTRTPSQMLSSAFESGIHTGGNVACEICFVPTQTLSHMTEVRGSSPRVIAVSHNAPEFNGIRQFAERKWVPVPSLRTPPPIGDASEATTRKAAESDYRMGLTTLKSCVKEASG